MPPSSPVYPAKKMAENTVTNVEGLAKQAMLGAEALMMMGGMLGLTPQSALSRSPWLRTRLRI